MTSRCEYRRRFVAVRLGTTRPKCSYIISVRVWVARISAVMPMVYSGLSRFGIFTGLVIEAAPVAGGAATRAASANAAPSSGGGARDHDSECIRCKCGREPASRSRYGHPHRLPGLGRSDLE